jgi:hypothetical protein
MYAVRTALPKRGAGRSSPLGTALLFPQDEPVRQLWQEDLNCHVFSGENSSETSRRLEIFLDRLSNQASGGTSFVLDPEFADLLSEEEQRIASQLKQLGREFDAKLKAMPVMAPLADVLANYGLRR